MIFAKKTVGVEINSAGITFSLVSGKASAPKLERISSTPFTNGIVRSSLREPNILDPNAFVDHLKSGHNLLLHNSKYLSVTLPDSVGRVILMNMEGRFKSRSEALDMIRWKLKKSIPFDISNTRLDYQLLKICENGEMALLVSIASNTVIGQYEELILSAGFIPSQIDFNSLNLHTLFEQRLNMSENCMIISFYNHALGVVAYQDGVPEFIRVKKLTALETIDSRIFMEINNSLMLYRDRFPGHETSNLFCIASPELAKPFCDSIKELIEIEPVMLEITATVLLSGDLSCNQRVLFPFSASTGAAMRSL